MGQRLMFADTEVEPPVGPFRAEVVRYFAGNREFKTEWGAWCHLAKMSILQEVEEAAKEEYRGFWTSKQAKDQAFRDRFGGHYSPKEPEKSPFRAAVERRARELREAYRKSENRQ